MGNRERERRDHAEYSCCCHPGGEIDTYNTERPTPRGDCLRSLLLLPRKKGAFWKRNTMRRSFAVGGVSVCLNKPAFPMGYRPFRRCGGTYEPTSLKIENGAFGPEMLFFLSVGSASDVPVCDATFGGSESIPWPSNFLLFRRD